MILMSETRKDVCIRLWRLMKQPFVLPCGYAHTHDCKWKAIDAGLLGCELCGAIHACADLLCKNIIETDSVGRRHRLCFNWHVHTYKSICTH